MKSRVNNSSILSRLPFPRRDANFCFPAAVALFGVKNRSAKAEGLLRNQHSKPAAKPAGGKNW